MVFRVHSHFSWRFHAHGLSERAHCGAEWEQTVDTSAHETEYENPSTLIVSGERKATSKYVFCGAQPNGLCIVHAKSPSCVRPTHIYILQSSFYLFIYFFQHKMNIAHTQNTLNVVNERKWMRSSRSQRVARTVKRNTNTRRRPILIHSINWLK